MLMWKTGYRNANKWPVSTKKQQRKIKYHPWKKDKYLVFSFLLMAKDSETPLRENCPYLELLWSAFSRIWTKYGEILRICPYSIQMWKNADQNNSEYGHFLQLSLDVANDFTQAEENQTRHKEPT